MIDEAIGNAVERFGWTDATLVAILTDYIAQDGATVALAAYLNRRGLEDSDQELRQALGSAVAALEGSSNDDEHEALYELAETVAGILGVEFSSQAPQ